MLKNLFRGFLDDKFSLKELLVLIFVSILLCAPWYPIYLSLNLKSQILFCAIQIISLTSILFLIIHFLVRPIYGKYGKYGKYGNNKDIKNIKLGNNFETIQRLRELKPGCFESFVEELFRIGGYEIAKGPNYLGDKPQVDGGKDLIVKKSGENNVYVQIKKKFAYMVQSKDIAAFKGVIGENKGIFITTSIFSIAAKNLGKEKNISCVDYECLLKKIETLDPKSLKKLEYIINDCCNVDFDFNFKHTPRTCKKCGAPMKRGKWGDYYCLNYYSAKKCDSKEYL